MIDTTQKEADKEQRRFSVDLMAYYKVVKEEMEKTIRKAEREKWTVEKLTKELESLV